MLYKGIVVNQINLAILLKNKVSTDLEENKKQVQDWFEAYNIDTVVEIKEVQDDMVIVEICKNRIPVITTIEYLYDMAAKFFPEVKINLELNGFVVNEGNSVTITRKEFLDAVNEWTKSQRCLYEINGYFKENKFKFEQKVFPVIQYVEGKYIEYEEGLVKSKEYPPQLDRFKTGLLQTENPYVSISTLDESKIELYKAQIIELLQKSLISNRTRINAQLKILGELQK